MRLNTKHIFLLIFCFGVVSTSEAQLLKKLKKKAEKAIERTVLKKTDSLVAKKTEKTIDGVVGGEEGDAKDNNSKSGNIPIGTEFSNPSLENNTEAKKAWYTSDLRVTSYDKDKQSDMVNYFDADAVAMQSNYKDQRTGQPVTSFIDSNGFFISYSSSEGQYTKSQLLNMPGMNMMAPSMMGTAYKLPVQAIYEAMEEMESNGLAVYPFMHVDFPFVLKPDHFRDGMVSSDYIESQEPCRNNMGCTKFNVTEAGYKGSYILFDNEDRLVEINVNVENDPFYGSGKGKIAYFYEECEVKVPKAVEKKMLGQDLLIKGLNPNKN
ncbi:hypothetical protein EYD45_02140 [Hyunsoonleella flava]|uniref:Uncharacterized protein n=1 Tax=Hyunsoonleella flava TaxID=2527939 RepID=A0A4Q9FJA2_9FLAO|nr:hypothetical protein [Hyunsoonleella flava]TBN06705.1 hypothetical protein EYD45_02140 [Hyunsoonleella flava]